MRAFAFFDTNILIYADDDRAAQWKRERAQALIAEHLENGTFVISVQVMQEYYNSATRKLGMDPALAQKKVELLSLTRIVRFEASDVLQAIELHRLLGLSFWDALIVQAARSVGAAVLFSEDFQSGAVIGGVKVVNPFALQ